MESTVLLLLLSFSLRDTQASTHWMVTETGLLEPKADSPFLITRPNDLMAFVNQGTRWQNILYLYHDLAKRQPPLKKLWSNIEKHTDLSIHFGQDWNCIKSGHLSAIDWYASYQEDGSARNIPDIEYMMHTFNDQVGKVPDCKKITALNAGTGAFEHLEGLYNKGNLSMTPENTLPEKISAVMSVDQFGHWLNSVLKINTSSWLHYNMASLYWRSKGNAPNAMECSRRAVHFAPRTYKDVALLGMGTILHASKRTDDAILVLKSSLGYEPLPMAHYIIANAYAIVGDFNASIRHYNQCLAMTPGFRQATKNMYAVLCYRELMRKMQDVKKNIEVLGEDLNEYLTRETHWMQSQAALLRTMQHLDGYDLKVENVCKKTATLTGLDIYKLKKEAEIFHLIHFYIVQGRYNDDWMRLKGILAVDSLTDLQKTVDIIERQMHTMFPFVHDDYVHERVLDGKLVEMIGPNTIFKRVAAVIPEDMHCALGECLKLPDTTATTTTSVTKKLDLDTDFEKGVFRYPSTMKVNRQTHDFDKDFEWPSSKLCKDSSKKFPENLEAIYPVFLPFENKGIRLKGLLSDRIGVPVNMEHELPWYPPTCPHDKPSPTLKKSQKQQITNEIGKSDELRMKLMEYVGDGNIESVIHMQDAELGQRIHTAIDKEVAPKWLIYTLASLYWRVRDNKPNALNCLQAASRSVKTRHRDIVMTSLASVYLEMGYFDEAFTAAEEAFRLSLYEPATNFILAELNMIKRQRNTHMFHLKQVVRVEPDFMNGLARNLLVGWACVSGQSEAPPQNDIYDESCSPVCDPDGNNCMFNDPNCFTSRDKESSRVIRLLEQTRGTENKPADFLDNTVFEPFIAAMPTDTTDKDKHAANFRAMMDLVGTLKGCGDKGCRSITTRDLALKERDCLYQHLQQGYWLNIITFREIMIKPEMRIPPEITMLPPSSKKAPECRLTTGASDDFFLERFTSIDLDGKAWEPIASIMQQLVEMTNVYDFAVLGQKIAKYVDSRPRSWIGALVAGWWCGAGGHGVCAARCLAAASAHAPPQHRAHGARTLAALLHLQGKYRKAKEISYLLFYSQPKNKVDACLVGIAHTYLAEHDQAIWMYRYALSFDPKFLAAKACLHANMCIMLYGEVPKKRASTQRA